MALDPDRIRELADQPDDTIPPLSFEQATTLVRLMTAIPSFDEDDES